MGEALDAELLVLDDDVLRILAVDRDELGEVGLRARQALGELQADAGAGGLGIGFVVDHAEAVLGTHLVVGRARIGVLDQRQALLHRVERGAPQRAPGERIAEHDEGTGLERRGAAALVGAESCGAGVDRQVVAFGVALGVGLDGE